MAGSIRERLRAIGRLADKISIAISIAILIGGFAMAVIGCAIYILAQLPLWLAEAPFMLIGAYILGSMIRDLLGRIRGEG